MRLDANVVGGTENFCVQVRRLQIQSQIDER
jgi:hypothetical protein